MPSQSFTFKSIQSASNGGKLGKLDATITLEIPSVIIPYEPSEGKQICFQLADDGEANTKVAKILSRLDDKMKKILTTQLEEFGLSSTNNLEEKYQPTLKLSRDSPRFYLWGDKYHHKKLQKDNYLSKMEIQVESVSAHPQYGIKLDWRIKSLGKISGGRKVVSAADFLSDDE